MGSVFGALAGMSLLAILLVVVVGIAIAALLLMVSFRLVVGYMPSFLRAMGAVVLTAIASAVALGLAQVLLGGGRLLAFVVQFLLGAAMVNWLLLAENGLRIGYGKACLVQLVYLVMEIVIGVVLAIAVAVLFGAAVMSMHH
ncbi:MAG TPA: hypothetical protein VFW82_07555 [Dyella sp.]|nr:hypothetical protein [Dyella sp.]